MRYFYWLIFIICFVEIAAAEPYTAVITMDGATVHSGPDNEFYPVLQLRSGDQVEIYFERDEWCAIRPPVGSFSWVSAKYITVGAGNVGTVLANGLASRIGSDYSDDCETVQVTLKKGESVFILERREQPENSASPVWLKIAPPNGEFRWIHKSAFSNKEPGTAYPNIQQVRYDANPKEFMISEIPKLPKNTEPVQSTPIPKVASAHPFSTTRRSSSVPTVADPFQRAFNELQRESHVVMTRPTDDEVFVVLIQRAQELHQIAPTDSDLERTYHLLESLQRTRAVRQELVRRRPPALSKDKEPGTVSSVAPQTIIPAYTPTSAQSGTLFLSGGESPAFLRAGVNVGGYDIVGRLGEFDPLPKGHPPYAVVDEKGQIICLITPSANLDLPSFVGQFVGINGILSYYEKPGKLRSRHLTAQNIQSVR